MANTAEAAAQQRADRITLLKGLLSALHEYVKGERELVTTAAEQQGQNWRTSADAVAGVEQALRTGEGAEAMRQVGKFVALPFDQMPVDRDLINNIQERVRLKYPDTREGDAQIQREMWQQFAEEVTAPATDPSLLGTYQEMERLYGPAPVVGAEDTTAFQNMPEIQAQVKLQRGGVERARDVAQQFYDAQGWLREHPTATATEVDQYIASVWQATPATSLAFQDLEKYARTKADAPVELTGDQKVLYNELDATRKELEKLLRETATTATGETDRDKTARIVASARYQWWAKANGFDVGTVVPIDAGTKHTHMEGIETPVGLYREGPDDAKALKLAQEQLGRKTSRLPWQHRRTPGTPSYGKVTVKYPGTPDPAYNVDGSYYYMPGEKGGHEYLTKTEREDLLQQEWKAAVVKAHMAGNPTLSIEDANKLPVAPMEDADRQAMADQLGVKQTAEPQMLPNAGQVLTGKILAPDAKDPVGSVHILTSQGEQTFTPDQMLGPVEVTSGGGPRQNLAHFLDVARGRVAANTEEQRRDNPPKPVAENLAARVVPERYGEGDKAAVAERKQEASDAEQMERQRLAKAALQNPDGSDNGVPYSPSGRVEAAAIKRVRRDEEAEDPADEHDTRTDPRATWLNNAAVGTGAGAVGQAARRTEQDIMRSNDAVAMTKARLSDPTNKDKGWAKKALKREDLVVPAAQ